MSKRRRRNATAQLDFAVAIQSLPATCADHLPHWTRARLVGPRDGPLLLVLGGISSNADIAVGQGERPGWWSNLFGPGGPLGCDRCRILGIDFLADEKGGFAPDTFEQASIIADTIVALREEPAAIVGASYGGMVALAYAQRFQACTKLVIISAAAAPHPMATACRSLQRQVVRLGIETREEQRAMAIARGMAMLTYRTPQEFQQRFRGGIPGSDPCTASEPLDYLQARGESFALSMPAGRFLSLSASIDRHRIDPARIAAPALVIGTDEDALVPVDDVEALASEMAGPSEFRSFQSIYGHDAFLKEPARLAGLIGPFLEGHNPVRRGPRLL